ncbi:hypothetical protein [Tenacibaculum xiamenense]|uniref:hypothetical protein n=1 Tax=Tenacibaculum xiamenense TaxID=1261553 RepID=UPI0038934024
MKPKTFKKHLIFWIALLSSWISFIIIPFFWFLPFAFWLIILFVLWIKKSNLKWYLIGLSSWTILPFLSFCFGINFYFNGNAHLKTTGYPFLGFGNLDKKYRVYNSTSGCLVTGIEPLLHTPNNLAIKLCTKIFGYQKGAYSGFYPTFKQSNELINQYGQELPYTIGKDSLYFTNESYNYKLRMITFFHGYEMDPSIAKVKMVSHKNELIIVGITSDSLKVFHLIDRKTGENFAKYIGNRENNRAY